MNSDPPRLLEQLDPPRRREGYWIAGASLLVAVVVGSLLLKSGRGEPIQTTTIASAIVSPAPAPAKDESAAATAPVAAPEAPPPVAHAPRRSAHHAAPKPTPEKAASEVEVGASATAKPAPAKVDPKDEPLPDFPVPAQH